MFSGLILIVLLATAFLKNKLYTCYPCTSIFLPLDLSSKVDWSNLYREGKISVDYGAVVKKCAQKRGLFMTFKSGVVDYFRNTDFTGGVDDSVLATYIKLDGTDVDVSKTAFGRNARIIHTGPSVCSGGEKSVPDNQKFHCLLSIFR